MTLTRPSLCLLFALVAFAPACLIRRENFEGPIGPAEDAPMMDAALVTSDTRADVGRTPPDAGNDAFMPGADAYSPDAFACGGASEACCTTGPECRAELSCLGGHCEHCGATTEPCCAGSACPGGVCDMTDSTCYPCGGEGDRCCIGNTCASAALGCSGSGRCEVCGGSGQPCCSAGPACGSMLMCRTGTCAPAASGGCDALNGMCCTGLLGDFCTGRGLECNGGSCTSRCGALGQSCCWDGWCRMGSCDVIAGWVCH